MIIMLSVQWTITVCICLAVNIWSYTLPVMGRVWPCGGCSVTDNSRDSSAWLLAIEHFRRKKLL